MPADDRTTDPAEALAVIAAEVSAATSSLTTDRLEPVLELLAGADRVFVHGAGRSGLALRMTAMRLMHLGLVVHVVGDVTTPAIRGGDVLLTASGSGTTGGIVRAAKAAVDAGARVAAITTAADSPLAGLASAVVVVPAADKLDRSGAASAQYSGGLFEQVVVLTGDALFHALWQRRGDSADELWPRHANLE
ncbi:6-phospho-3-hexuloisomerase [Rathayibacter sp. AY1A3]|uniref:6-phospho-3-hexuloisomerase n=1 Tax=Rathayibacter sp. AY1A3 TaxID=2080521 RepID=UPI000CE82C64|nr:6-phospho-3-hexuloisomerase [Rathayibacter sp. AY1A3]PPF41116.1 6-phospho-3-hexuloisomerase [Rathayibacter sp. AY1A3]